MRPKLLETKVRQFIEKYPGSKGLHPEIILVFLRTIDDYHTLKDNESIAAIKNKRYLADSISKQGERIFKFINNNTDVDREKNEFLNAMINPLEN